MNKTAQIQLRVTPAEKSDLVRRARAAGLDLSAWMLQRLLPDRRARFVALVRSLAATSQPAYVLAEIHDLLAALRRIDFSTVTETLSTASLDEVRANQLAAMVETTAARIRVRSPDWVDDVSPLRNPWFASELLSLRLHLLCNSPPAFRRRNLFVDSTIGDRV
jgi:uncharacterized protein (DUF1778 family)